MTAVNRLLQLATEAEQLFADWKRLNDAWDAALEAISDASSNEDANGILAGVAVAEQVGPDLLAVLTRLDAIEAEADDVFTAAQEEFEQSIQPARDKISTIYLEIPAPDATWNDELDWHREEAAELMAGPEQTLAARPLGFFRVAS